MRGNYANVNDTSEQYYPDERERTIETVLERVITAVRDGIDHGYFSIEITGGDASSAFTKVVVSAGRMYRFTIPKLK